jgi:four helix bundle protein
MTIQHYQELEVWQFAMELGEKCHLVSMARGSFMELETHLLLSQRASFLDQAALAPLLALVERISRMLSGLRKALEKRLSQ